jgi:hypothetical protein
LLGFYVQLRDGLQNLRVTEAIAEAARPGTPSIRIRGSMHYESNTCTEWAEFKPAGHAAARDLRDGNACGRGADLSCSWQLEHLPYFNRPISQAM